MFQQFSIRPSRRSAAFVALIIAEFFYSWAWNTVDVLRPFFKADLSLTLIQAGSAYSAQGAGALCGALLIGQLADRFGQRRMLPITLVGYGSALIAGVWVGNYLQLLAQRYVVGVFLGGVFPVVVGIYVGLFGVGVRGRLASILNATFSAAIIALGISAAHIVSSDWRTLLWIGGLPPIVLALPAAAIMPSQPRVSSGLDQAPMLPLTALFSPTVRRRTLLLTAVVGLNFFAYQAFSGWLTVYLSSVRQLPLSVIGSIVATQFSGNVIGSFVWGWIGDRYGRKTNAWGLAGCGLASVLVLVSPGGRWVIGVLGFLYGFMLSASVIWGPWIAELYPAHLRSTAASIFHWGRLVSFFAPLITAPLAELFGLRAAMLTAGAIFLLAAVIWSRLPETLISRRALTA